MFMAFVIGFGAAWTQAAAFVTNSVNCLPRHRGVVVGLLQASCAFSGGWIYSLVFLGRKFPSFFSFMLLSTDIKLCSLFLSMMYTYRSFQCDE